MGESREEISVLFRGEDSGVRVLCNDQPDRLSLVVVGAPITHVSKMSTPLLK